MITPDEAKKLKAGDILEVTNTKQQWTVDHVEVHGVMPFVHISRESNKSLIPPERLHLFSPVTANDNVAKSVTDENGIEQPNLDFDGLRANLTNSLQNTVETATADLTAADAKHIKERIEDHFLEEPELQKPAHKLTAKEKKEAKAKKDKKVE